MNLPRFRLLSIVPVLLLSASAICAEEPATRVTTLPNGLAVIVVENHAAPVASVHVHVRAGSMLEGKYLGSGVSHLTEHLVSGGSTKWRREFQYDKIRADLGGNGNASTSTDRTRYYINTTGAKVFEAIDILSEWTMGAAIDYGEFYREKGVVTRELERSGDNPETEMYYAALQNVYRVSPARHPVIGYLEQMKAITREQVVDYYETRYVPGNMVVVAVGDFDAKKVEAHIAKAFAKKDRRIEPALALEAEPEQVAPRRVVRERADVKTARLRVDYPTVSLTHPDMYALDVLSFILSQGQGSRLVRRLRDDLDLVSSVRTWSHTPDWGAGYFGVYAQLEPAKLEAAERAIVAELDRLKTELVSDEELARAKKQKSFEHEMGRQTVGDQAGELAANTLSTFDPDFGRHYTGNIQKVTREMIRDVARKYFVPERTCVTVMVPEGSAAAATAAETREIASSPIRRFVLPNGAVLLVKRNTATPMVSVQAHLVGGLRAETRAGNGISSMMVAMLPRGTTTRSAQEIADAFAAMGTAIGADSGNNSFNLGVEVLSRDLPSAMTLFADVLLNPSFPEKEVTQMRERRLFALKRESDNPMQEAERFFRENLFARHPYGMMPLGTAQSVSRLTRDDLVAFHRRTVHPQNLVLAVFGDVEIDEARQLATRTLGAFTGRGVYIPPRPPSEEPLLESRTALKVTKKQQAVVYAGTRGITVKNIEDRAVLAVIDTVLSGYGYPGGWLHAELRGRSLVYVVHAFNVPGIDPGWFACYATCQPERVREVVEAITRNVMRIAISGAPPDEIATAKTLIATSERLWHQKNSDQARQAALDELTGIGYNDAEAFLARVDGVTNDDIIRVARKYFREYVLIATSPDASVASGVRPAPRIVTD